MDESKVFAPFTPAQVANLNGFQESGVGHAFTCADHSDRRLLAREPGWECPRWDCNYMQVWAHAWMADGTWRTYKA
jgi:hypothetical protein